MVVVFNVVVGGGGVGGWVMRFPSMSYSASGMSCLTAVTTTAGAAYADLCVCDMTAQAALTSSYDLHFAITMVAPWPISASCIRCLV